MLKNKFYLLLKIKEIIKKKFSVSTIKIALLSVYFFFVFGSYTLLKDLKDSIFMITVGTKYIPQVKGISLFLMIPLVIFYSWLSTKISRKNLMIIYSLLYGFGSLIIAFFLDHPSIGLINTVSSPYRLFGWSSYLFLEGANPFLVSLSWSFLSSISHPNNIKNSYLIMTIMSKLGGAVFACVAWLYANNLFTFGTLYSDVSLYIFIMKIAGIALLILPIIILIMTTILPKEELIGYNKEGDIKNTQTMNSFGLSALIKNSYVLGIFGMIFFWEVINFIFNNLRLNAAFHNSTSIAEISSFLFQSTMFMHLIGLFFVIFGTSIFVRKLGERTALLMIPILTGIIIFTFIFCQNPLLITIIYPFIGAINYSLSRPLRESLFIVTSKNIQFSTKQWIDSFGTKFSKTCGSLYTILLQYIPQQIIYSFQIGFFIVLFSLWILLAYYLGKEWKKAIKENKIIS
jgi:AAA family ATP:ADP antiporter